MRVNSRLTRPLDAITRISRVIAREHNRALTVVGVTSSDGGTDRVELLITLEGCHSQPCRLMINLERTGPEEFERQFRQRLHQALNDHRLQDKPDGGASSVGSREQ